MPVEFDEEAGEVRDGDIRYLLMRPDVLMGMISSLDESTKEVVLNAFQQSTFDNGRASMLQYKKRQFSEPSEALDFVCKAAAKLGWGSFSYSLDSSSKLHFKVNNSPFALGHGASDRAVCAPISGILAATIEVFFDKHVSVREISCAAQGESCCQFEIQDVLAKD